MAFRLHRLDAVHTAALAPPALSLVGNVPDAIKTLYQSFADRYPDIGLEAFRALNANTLGELGLGVNLLGGRLDINLKMDQLIGRATNLQTPAEVTFAQDCALLIHSAARKMFSNSSIGVTTLRISAWLNIQGAGSTVDELLHRLAVPSNPFAKEQIGGQRVFFMPRFEAANGEEGWHLLVTAERSAVAEADLFLLRDYIFAASTKVSPLEKQFAFVDSSTRAICNWLGIGELQV